MRLDPNELRKLADALARHIHGPQHAIPDLRRAADEIERLRRVYTAASALLDKSRHLTNCPSYPLGADCTRGLEELDEAITGYEEDSPSDD